MPGPDSGVPLVPPLAEGSISPREARMAEDLLERARDSLGAGSLDAALAAAREVVLSYPRAPGSGEALGIVARALVEMGMGGEGADAALDFARLLGPSHPRLPEALLLRARGLGLMGEGAAGIRSLHDFPASAPDSLLVRGRSLVRELIPGVAPAALQELAEGFPLSNPVRGLLAAELAVSLYLRGEMAEAERWAQAALAGPVEEREERLARGVLDRRLEEVLGRPVVLGAILPRSGVSPGQLQYGEWVYEGIQVALEEFKDRLRRPVRLEVVDDQGQPSGGRNGARALEGLGAMGVVGPLTQEILIEAGKGRSGALPIISPFAFMPQGESTGVLSLSGPDPAGARLVARYAWELGVKRVVVARPSTQEAGADARAFADEFEGLGGVLSREVVFDSGATFFQKEFREVETLSPDGLFLPLSPREIQLLAPQVTFYGLDTLGIQLLGTSGWTDDLVVLGVDSRHTDGVIAATTRRAQEESEAFQAFRTAYESFFQKTLRSELPAFGYDAAALFLSALEQGPRTPEELQEALNRIQGFPGATGPITIEGGRILREPRLVRIQDQELIYITSRSR